MKQQLKVKSCTEVTVDDVEYYVECTISGTCYYDANDSEENECAVTHIKIDNATRLSDNSEVTDPELLRKIELALNEDWAADCLWEEFEALRDYEGDGD